MVLSIPHRIGLPRGGGRAVVLMLSLVAFAPSPASGQEWVRFRGVNGAGISEAKTIPVSPTSSDFNWRVALPGKGHSSPVVWGRRVFVTSAEEEKGKRHLLSLDAATGAAQWTRSYAFKPYSRHDYNSAASGTPTVDSERVYAIWPTHESFTVIAVTHEGQEAWKRDFGAFPTQHGGGASPVLYGDLLIVTKEGDDIDGGVIALNRSTGETVWRFNRFGRPPTAYATPIVVKGESGKDELLVASTKAGITALDLSNGKPLWETGPLFPQRVVGSLIEAAGLIIITSGEGGGSRASVAVRPGKSPQVAWRLTRGTSYVPTPITHDGLLFFWHDGGIVLCVKPGTGETVWQERVGGGSYFGSPVCVNGKLYNMSAKGELVVIDAAGTFNPRGRVDLGEGSHSTPAVAGGVLYLRTFSHLVSIGGKKAAGKIQ